MRRSGPEPAGQDAAARRAEVPVDGVSAVMVSYRTGPVLWTAIDTVLAPDQDGVVELFLIDNGNPPDVVTALARRAETEPRLTFVTGHGNVGFARAANMGARLVRSRYLMLLNPDCRLGAGAVPALLAEAAALDGDWLLGCRVLDPDGRDQRGSRRALLTPHTALFETFHLDRLWPRRFRRHHFNHHDRPLPDGTTRVPAISGACMLLPAATFRAMGGLDEGYFLHVEDLDLCLRLGRAGVPVYFVPHVQAIHQRGSSAASPIRVEWHKTRGFLRYFRLHYRHPALLPVVAAIGAGALARFALKALRSLLHGTSSGFAKSGRRDAPRAEAGRPGTRDG